MTETELICFLESMGACVVKKHFNGKHEPEAIGVFIGESTQTTKLVGKVWNHALFLTPDHKKWVIGFSQFGKTRPLEDDELMEVLGYWLNGPSDEVFRDFEMGYP